MLSINKKQPKNKEDFYQKFYDDFKGIMPSIGKLKNISHVGSFGTQIVAIFPMALAYLPFSTNYINIPLACLICLVFGLTIELGISTFLPSSVRQVVGWRFYNGWFIAMFLAIFFFLVLPLLIASPTLSSMGGKTIGAMGVTEERRPATDSLTDKHNAQIMILDSLAQKEKDELRAAVELEQQPIINKYAGLIEIQQNIYDKYDKYQKRTGKAWPKDNMLKAKNKIAALEAEKNEQLAPILSSHKQEILAINKRLQAQKDFSQKQTDDKINGITSDYNDSKAESDFKKWIWSGIGIFLAAFFSFGTIVSVVIMIIFEKGSGKAYEAEIGKEESGNFFFNLLEDLSGKVAEYLPTAKAANITPERRQIGFNKSGKAATSKAANFPLEITNKAAKQKAATPPKSGKLPRNFAAPTSKSGKTQKRQAPKKAATSKAASGNKKVAANNQQLVQNTKRQLAANNGGKVTQKQVVKATGLSERTVRKYWK